MRRIGLHQAVPPAPRLSLRFNAGVIAYRHMHGPMSCPVRRRRDMREALLDELEPAARAGLHARIAAFADTRSARTG